MASKVRLRYSLRGVDRERVLTRQNCIRGVFCCLLRDDWGQMTIYGIESVDTRIKE